MKTTIQKWGNSSGIRLPKPLLQELHLDNGTRGRWRSMVSNVYIPEEGDIV
nr:hypothetical protein [uncultured Sphaerochaeta sp.]